MQNKTVLCVCEVPAQAQALQQTDDKPTAWMNSNGRDNWHVILRNGNVEKEYNIGYDNRIDIDKVAINAHMRQELGITLGQMIEVEFPNETLLVQGSTANSFGDALKHGDEGVTVRRGGKWHNYCNAKSHFNLREIYADGTEHDIGVGRVVDYQMCQFRDIPARIVEKEHCEDSRTYSGLLAAMKRVYPGFTETEEVTWIQYIFLEG